jgi:hypothetical protein
MIEHLPKSELSRSHAPCRGGSEALTYRINVEPFAI